MQTHFKIQMPQCRREKIKITQKSNKMTHLLTKNDQKIGKAPQFSQQNKMYENLNNHQYSYEMRDISKTLRQVYSFGGAISSPPASI